MALLDTSYAQVFLNIEVLTHSHRFSPYPFQSLRVTKSYRATSSISDIYLSLPSVSFLIDFHSFILECTISIHQCLHPPLPFLPSTQMLLALLISSFSFHLCTCLYNCSLFSHSDIYSLSFQLLLPPFFSCLSWHQHLPLGPIAFFIQYLLNSLIPCHTPSVNWEK